MKWNCAAVRRRVCEYHDGELTIDQRVAIQEHLRSCVACEAEAKAVMDVGSALRAAAAQRAFADDSPDLDGLAAGVLSRFRAEQEESFSRTVHRMFEDLHLVWAALGATTATFACLAITVGIFYFSRAERPDSLAALINTFSNPAGTNARPMQVDDDEMVLPRQEEERVGERAAVVPELLRDEEIMLDTTITREGRVASLQLMSPDDRPRKAADWKTVGSVLDSVAQARFVPARVGGEPVAVKMFWYFTYTTVVGTSGETDETVKEPKAQGEARHDLRLHSMHAA